MKSKFSSIIKKSLDSVADLVFKHQILIFIGETETYIAAYRGSKIMGTMSITTSQYKVDDYSSFLQKYKKYTAVIIVDRSDIQINHAAIPIAQSLIPTDHINKFIQKTLQPTDIVASTIFDITNNEGSEVWHTTLISTPETQLLMEWASYIASNLAHLKGVYFFPFSAPDIVNGLALTSKTKINSSLKIFVTITSYSGIRLVLCHKKKVMENHVIPFPVNKSLEYIQGVIEQAVSDCVISLKNYIHHNQERPSLILLVNKELEALLKQSKFDVLETLIFHTKNNDQFSDQTISSFLNKRIKHKASNDDLRSFNRTVWFNALLFKPLWLALILLGVKLTQNELSVVANNNNISKLNIRYYSASEKYRQQRELYPYIDHFSSVLDFHDAQIALTAPQKLPFDFLNQFLNKLPSNFTVHKIHWDIASGNQTTIVDAKYVALSSDTSFAKAALYRVLIDLDKIFTDYSITPTIDMSKALSQVGRVSIPIKLTIKER